MLDSMGIRWHDVSEKMAQTAIETAIKKLELPEKYVDYTIYRTHFCVGDSAYSVICGYATYGGEDGLLEMMGGGNDVEGWLTAEDVIGKIQDKLQGR
jgi:hypothetical protein